MYIAAAASQRCSDANDSGDKLNAAAANTLYANMLTSLSPNRHSKTEFGRASILVIMFAREGARHHTRILPDRNSTCPLLITPIWVGSCRPDPTSLELEGLEAGVVDVLPQG